MVYTSDDRSIAAKQLERDIGCVAVMPLAAPIGSGLGQNGYNLLIVENAKVPMHRRCRRRHRLGPIAMELGCDGVLMNTATPAKDPC